MKKKVFSLMMTLLLAFMGVARADELTVNDGTTTNGYVPVYGFYADAYLKCEFVQPAADLADMTGATINGLTFYASQTSVNWGAANFEVFLTEVDNTTLSTFVGDGTIVYQGALSIVDGMMNVTFTEPYTYNGGNLLIGVYNLATGSYVTSTWYGVEAETGASVSGYSYSSLSDVTGSQRNFLPKMKFDYTAGGSQGGEEVVVEIGDGTSTTYMVPFNSLYGYSFTEQIFTASEIGTAGNITSISFNLGQSYSEEQTNTYALYMKNVTRETFTATTDYEPVTSGDIVFQGEWTIPANTTGWITLNLDTPFAYDGTSNLMVGMLETTPSYSTRYFVYTSVTNSGISYYSDSYVPDPYNLGSYSGSKTLRSNRNNIQMSITTGGGSGLEPITEVYINDYVAPVWGEPVTQNVTIPEDANYTLMAADWFTYPHGYLPTRDMNPDPIYNLTDRDYVWGIMLTPNEGYEFPANVTAYINGSTDPVLMASVVPEAEADEDLPAGTLVVFTYAYYTYEEGLHTLSTYAGQESVDRLLIERPNGAWMEPYHFNLYNDGTEDVEVVLIDFLHNNGYFSMAEDTEYPFTVDATGRPGVDLYINTSIDWNSTDEINSKLAVNTNERSTHLYQIVAAPYQPYCPDVFELAFNLNNGNALNAGFTWRKHMSEIWDGPDPMELHANYDLPDYEENIPDGYDAVMKFTIDHPMQLNARVVEGYENGKVALYRADFDGEAGPMATNNYTGRPMAGGGGGGATGGAFEAQIGEGTSTTGYMPFYTLYNYSISEALYLADELSGNGVTTAPMTSLSWYATNSITEAQTGITIWMANTDATVAPATSPLASGMTKVYTGMLPANAPTGWTEFVFNAGSFAWDGHSNIMILVQRNCGDWTSSIQWQAHNPGFQAMGYLYTDSAPYNVETSTYTLTTSSTSRPNIIMKGGNRSNRDNLVYDFETGLDNWTTIDADGDGLTWVSSMNPGIYHNSGVDLSGSGHNSSNAYAISGSYANQTGEALTPDNYFVSPQVALDGSISFYACAQDASYSAEHFGVAVSTTNNTSASAFTTIQEWTMTAKSSGAPTRYTREGTRQGNWYQYTVDLSAYAGQTGYVAIRHFNCSDEFILNVDDITIVTSGGGTVDPTPMVPVTFIMGDSWGDGWNGASITITTDGGFSQTVTLGSGTEGTQIVNIPAGSQVTLTWNTGSYDYECSCDVVMDGEVIYSFSAEVGETFTFDIPGSDTPVNPVEITFHDWSAGPVITDLNVLPGTYYLVASSTQEDYEVEIGVSELPCAENSIAVYPVDNAMGIDPVGVVLRWALSPDCNQYRLVFGTTYYPEDEPEHPQTIITEWSSNLAESYALPTLWNNTNYFWRIEQRTGLSDENPGCVTVGDVFGFTTHLNVPQNLVASDEMIFEDEPVTLSWTPVLDRTYRQYYIYKDGVQVAQTPNNPNPNPNASFSYTFQAGQLTYNMEGYNFYVTAVYDEGESAPSNEVNVKVSGYSNTTGINGHVYEQDGTTPIAGVTVTITGTDEFGDSHTYTTTTNASGYYHQVVYAGNFTNAVATMAGYQDAVTTHALPFDVAYQGQENNVDFIMDENFVAPANVCAQTVYAPGVTGDTLVQVYWDFNFCDPFEAQIGTGTTTTGYFPFYTLYNYSIATALYKAEELAAAGVNTADMNSLSWYATNSPGYNQQGITIWMANTDATTAPTTSPLASGMTKVYTGAMTPAMGWNEFVFNEGSFAWDGESNILILVQRNNGSWNSTVNWQGTSMSGCMTYLYTDNAPYNVENQTYTLSAGSTRPNIIMKAVCDRQEEVNRSLHHFNIYRTDCYNDGPYNSENTDFVATAWVPDTSYFDVGWPTLAPGVYKYGVSAVYAGNRDDVVDYPFEDRESEIVWHTGCGPCLDKDMRFEDVTVNVLLNSADNPAGSTVNFVNNNPGEEQNHPMGSITIDESAYYAFESFRRGEYTVTVSHPGYITETHYIDLRDDNNYRDVFDEYDQEGNLVQHHDNTIAGHDLRFVLTEIIYNPINLYVSRTGWATWAPFIPEGGDTPIVPVDPTGGDNAFSFSFDNGMEGWTTIDADGDGLTWVNSANSMSASGYDYTGLAHSGENFVYSQSYIDYDGAYSADNYLVSPQMYSITSGSTLTFWADNANDSYPDNFSVVVSTVANPTANDFVAVYSHSGAKGGDRTAVRHNGNRYQNWRQHTVNLGAYAGQNVWIAFRHNDTDEYEIWIDDVTLAAGRDDERHLEGYKVLCTSIDGQPIYNTNTVNPFCQLATENLVEGEQYICYVASIYSTGMSEYISCTWQYESCENYAGTVDGVHIDNNVVSWTYPGDGGDGPTPPPTGGSNFTVDFEGGMPEGWTVNDANNDGYTWCLTSAIPSTWTYYASLDLDWYHGGSNAICSGSYINGVGALNPNEYLISPQVNLVNGSQLSFWVAATDENYAADHFGVFVSTTGTNPSDFTSVQEWTLTAKRGAMAGDARATRDGEGMRLGNWYNYTVDLSAYAGQAYIAFRHFNCTDQYIMVLDDITLSTGAKGNFAYTEEDYIKMNSLAPRTENENVEPMPAIPGNRSNNAYACNAYGGTNPTGWITYNIDTPSNGTSLNSNLTVYGGSIAADGYVYATYNDNTWKKIDPLTGNVEGQGSLGMFFVDCAYDYTTDVMYGSYSGTLYTWDLATHTTAEVGAMHGSMQMIACDLNGQLYGIEYQTGDFFAIDKTTGACTLIGNTGQSPAYVQSGGFDHETGKLYWAGYTSTGIFAEVNLSNGSLTMLGTNVGEQLSWSVPYEYNPAPVPVPASGEILGAMIFVDGEWEAFVEYPTNEYVYEGDGQEVCVRIVYNGPAELPSNNIMWSMSCEECEGGLEPAPECEAGDPIYAEVLGSNDNVHIWWGAGVEPEPVEGDTWTYDFENSSMEGLQSIDSDGDGYGWVLGTAIGGVYLVDGASLAGSGHNSSNDLICSGSYSNVVGALNPDNFLVFPQSTIVNGSTFSFWACAQDASYAAEHFSVAVSTDGNAWTNVQEWTMTSKGAKSGVRDARAQGSWHSYSVDLSDYAGQDVFIAIRHFNCTDMFILDVDDVELSINRATTDGIVSYNVYRSTDNLTYEFLINVPVNEQNLYEVFDAPEAGTYYYMVKALYEDGCESEGAIDGNNPQNHYVMVGVTGVGENSAEVSLFPNPTKGNVTIQAMGMHRITVVSVLGQVVYDTELDQDEFILNMGQFNTGMYMVRVYTNDGVAVKRVTVMH